MVAGQTRAHLDKIKDETYFYPHQLEGIRTLARMRSWLLADEMGLGKTLQALTVAAIDFQQGFASRILVVCPATLKWNWLDEIKKHTLFGALVLDGDRFEKERQLQLFDIVGDILIVNYEQVNTYLEDLNSLNFDIVIYDEAHFIKNPKAKRSKACLELRGNRHFLLTGSPLLNQVNELWPILHRINSSRWPNYHRFCNRYCRYGGWKGKQIIGPKNKPELSAELKAIMVRRLKKDCIDLPGKLPIIKRYVELLPLQRELYDQANDNLQIEMPGSMGPMELENALTKYLRLKQICGTTATIPGYADVSAKLDLLVPDVYSIVNSQDDDRESKPTVVFTQFRDVLECAVQRLEAAGMTVFQIHGDVPKPERVGIALQCGNYRDANGQRAVMACMLHGNLSIGLNFAWASTAHFIDKLYVPKLNEQAQDRLDRIGQTEPVTIIEYIARKTIESRIEAILKTKTNLFDTVVEESDWKRALIQAMMSEDEDE